MHRCKTAEVCLLFTYLFIWGSVVGFYPNSIHRLLPDQKVEYLSTTTHQRITEDALKQVARSYMIEHPELYQSETHELEFRSKSFLHAKRAFHEHVSRPDTDPQLKDKPIVHFDAESFVGANDLLLEYRWLLMRNILDEDFETARQNAGLILHTLQDFYSHSNWIEMHDGATDPYEELGEKSILVVKVASRTQPTCSDCSRFRIFCRLSFNVGIDDPG